MRMICFILQGAPQVATSPHPAADEFVKIDPTGMGMTVIAMTIVFVVLTIIYLILKYISKIYLAQSARIAAKKERQVSEAHTIKDLNDLSAETSAAIAMAIHMYYNQQHDMESLKLTIQKVSRMYSPWSSKIYSLRQLPR